MSLVLAEWIGRTQRTFDWITPNRISAWHATLDHGTGTTGDGGPAPLGFHWTLAQPAARESELGPDGHARRGTFLPPIELPRRLWAGSRVRFCRPLRVGERVERRSEIASITEKTGRDSPLVFVTVRHQLLDIDGLAIDAAGGPCARSRPLNQSPHPGIPSSLVEPVRDNVRWLSLSKPPSGGRDSPCLVGDSRRRRTKTVGVGLYRA